MLEKWVFISSLLLMYLCEVELILQVLLFFNIEGWASISSYGKWGQYTYFTS